VLREKKVVKFRYS